MIFIRWIRYSLFNSIVAALAEEFNGNDFGVCEGSVRMISYSGQIFGGKGMNTFPGRVYVFLSEKLGEAARFLIIYPRKQRGPRQLSTSKLQNYSISGFHQT